MDSVEQETEKLKKDRIKRQKDLSVLTFGQSNKILLPAKHAEQRKIKEKNDQEGSFFNRFLVSNNCKLQYFSGYKWLIIGIIIIVILILGIGYLYSR